MNRAEELVSTRSWCSDPAPGRAGECPAPDHTAMEAQSLTARGGAFLRRHPWNPSRAMPASVTTSRAWPPPTPPLQHRVRPSPLGRGRFDAGQARHGRNCNTTDGKTVTEGSLSARRGVHRHATGVALAGLPHRDSGPAAPQAGAESIVLQGEQLRTVVIRRPAGTGGGCAAWPSSISHSGFRARTPRRSRYLQHETDEEGKRT